MINVHLGGEDAFASLLWQGRSGRGWLVNVQAETGMLGSLFPPVFCFFSMITINKSRCLLKPKVSICVPKLKWFLSSVRGYVEDKSTSREFPTLPFFSPSSPSVFPFFLPFFFPSYPLSLPSPFLPFIQHTFLCVNGMKWNLSTCEMKSQNLCPLRVYILVGRKENQQRIAKIVINFLKNQQNTYLQVFIYKHKHKCIHV